MSGNVKKECRVCGKLYTPCVSCENDKSIFHWRAVACSPECAREYVQRVEKARSSKTVSLETRQTTSEKDPISIVSSDVIEETKVKYWDKTQDADILIAKSADSIAPRKKNRKKKTTENIEQIENERVY